MPRRSGGPPMGSPRRSIVQRGRRPLPLRGAPGRTRWSPSRLRCRLNTGSCSSTPPQDPGARLRGNVRDRIDASASRVAAREDETKPIVLHVSHHLRGAGLLRTGGEHRHLVEQVSTARLAAQAVDGTSARCRHDPAAWVGRETIDRPLAQGDGERILHGILGDVDVTEDPDQGRHASAGLLAEDPADRGRVDRG